MACTRTEIHTPEEASSGYHLLYSTHAKYEKDWRSYKHTHRFAELFYVCSGSGSFCIEDESFPIAQHNVILVNPNVVHSEFSSQKFPLEYITLGVGDLNFAFGDDRDYVIFHDFTPQSNLSFYFHSIYEEMEAKEYSYESVCNHLLEVLIVHLLRITRYSAKSASSRSVSRECSRAKRYIDSNFALPLDLDNLAAVAHLNKYYFAHTFTQTYGISPMSYLTQRRIISSQELLKSTDMSISEIAHQCGFSSQSYFAQCFRRTCNMTAANYRKLHLQGAL